jgi:hypothetical protein
MSTNPNVQNKSSDAEPNVQIKSSDNLSPIHDLLLKVILLTSIGLVTSRIVMGQVGYNNGRDCPKTISPAVACTFYGMISIILIWAVVRFRYDGKLNNNFNFSLFIALIACCIGLFSAYVAFTIKVQNNSSNDTECLTQANKDAIEKIEIIMNFILIILLILVIFINNK